MEEITEKTSNLAIDEGSSAEVTEKNEVVMHSLDQYSDLIASMDIPKSTLADETVLALKLGYGCPHSPSEPCPECHKAFYTWMKDLYLAFKNKLGLEHDLTLNALIDCAYEYIKAYQLTLCDNLLKEGYEACKARGKNDSYYIKMIQAMAFLRFKQSKFQEAVILFEEMKEILGPNPSLLENTGHAYNSIGDQKNAERCFTEALDLISKDSTQKAHKGGLLLGLGLVKSRLGNHKDGLVLLEEALQWYIDEHDGADNALIAKSHVSVAGCLEELERYEEAEDHLHKAIRIFIATCGVINPLTADALRKLGLNLIVQEKWEKALETLKQSLISSVGIDTFSINLNNLVELVVSIMKVQSELGKDENDNWYIELIRKALLRLLQRDESIAQNGNFSFLFQLCIKDIPPETIKALTEGTDLNL